jgi:ATP-dependent DNA helicase RecQ
MADARRALQAVWGYDDFRPVQARALETVLSGRDLLAVFPTGGGKSLCYQVPALLGEGVTIVVSPLISLMKDQIDAIVARGVPAAFLNSTQRPGEIDTVLAALSRGELRLLYVSPERFDSEDFTRAVASARVTLFAVDEAHCVSVWGHDFRPAYRRLGAHRAALFPDAPLVAVTATATPRVRRDIVDQLAMRDPAVQVGGFDRPNLHWSVVSARDEATKLAATLKALRGLKGSAIVYVSTQDGARDVARALSEAGHTTAAYHAGLSDARRKAVQDSFMSGELRTVVATNAFGMGIDKPDIRLVLHYAMPGSMEALYQEAGRAGRDGERARSVLLHAPADRLTHEYLIQQAHPTRATVEAVYRVLAESSDEHGVHANPAQDAARALGLRNPRPVYAALRVLSEAGVIEHTTPQRQALHLTVRAPTERIAEVLRARGREADRSVLRQLWKHVGEARLYAGASVRRSVLEGFPGGADHVVDALGRLEADGIVEWRLDPLGTRLLVARVPPARLQVDWGAVEARRKLELAKLDAVEHYALRRGCRRRAMLDYFRDDSGDVACSGCDYCDRIGRR